MMPRYFQTQWLQLRSLSHADGFILFYYFATMAM